MEKAIAIATNRRMLGGGMAALVLGIAVIASMTTGFGRSQAGDGANAQLARLYLLQAAFHEAGTVPDPGEPNDVAQRVQDVLELFADEATLTFAGTTYTGKGSCEPGSLTICDFFTNVAGPFQPGNRWVSLAPAFGTSFEIHGNTASVYFECHFFDENWDDQAHLAVTATAKYTGGRWVFTDFPAIPIGVPYP
jgi:hypothetical protein